MRALSPSKLILAAAALLLGACTGSERQALLVDRVQLLAVKANPATAERGEKIRLEVLIASPRENDPTVSQRWFVCPLDFEECSTADIEEMELLGTGRSVETIVPSTILPGDTMLYWVDVLKNGKVVDRAIKGIYIHPENEPENRNPNLNRVRWGGESPVASAFVGDRVRVRVASSEVINEVWLEAGEPASEDVQVRTYVTGGFLTDPSGSGASGELFFRADARGRYGTWIVVHDQRGGVDWFEHWISVVEEEAE